MKIKFGLYDIVARSGSREVRRRLFLFKDLFLKQHSSYSRKMLVNSNHKAVTLILRVVDTQRLLYEYIVTNKARV